MHTKFPSQYLKGRPSRRWEDDIKTYLRITGREDVDWIHLDQDRDQWLTLVDTVMNLRVPYRAGNSLINWVTVSFSNRTLLHAVS
jgi:hypothetical protein